MTRTRSGKIADTWPQASRRDLTTRPAKAVERSIDNTDLATDHAERSDIASTAAIADRASICTENATKDHAANKTVPSAPEDPAPSHPALPNESATSAAVLCEADSVDNEIVPPMPPMHLVDTAAKGLALLTSTATNTACAERTTEVANIPVPEMTAGPEASLCHPSEEARTLTCAAGNSQLVAELEFGTTKRRSERPARKRGIRPLITIPNSPGTFFSFLWSV